MRAAFCFGKGAAAKSFARFPFIFLPVPSVSGREEGKRGGWGIFCKVSHKIG